jgi:hypothetical protein
LIFGLMVEDDDVILNTPLFILGVFCYILVKG